MAAHFAALCLFSSSAFAAVVDSGVVNLPVAANIDGLYLNLVTGVSANATVAGWDFNPFLGGGNLAFFSSNTAANVNAVVGVGTVVTALTPGTVVGPASTYATVGTVTTTGTTFRATGTSFVGFRFQNEANGNSLHYGYAEMTTTAANGFPATVVRYVWDNTPNTAVTIAGGAVPPQFAYAPASGQPVPFTGGSLVGTTGNGSITVSIGTAGSGAGAPATTTTTCTAPSAPFSGFGQSISAIGNGAISGTTLSGTCTLGAAEVTQTLTCNESRGGAANARTFTLTCPAGTQPALTSTPASGSLVTLAPRPLGGAASTAPISFQNPGTLPATVTCTQPANTAFTASPLSIVVPANGSASTTVSYTSTAVGTTAGVLNCSFGAQNFTFNLQGSTLLPAPAFIPTNNVWTLALMALLMSLLAGVAVMRRQG
ncbi:MAG: hypothetical protein ACT4NL_19140 [Pseudomarimonas sp.]